MLEILFQIGDLFSKKNGLWLIALVVLIAPPIILWKYPDQYTPMVETLLNAILFGLALYLGRLDTLFPLPNTRTQNGSPKPQVHAADF